MRAIGRPSSRETVSVPGRRAGSVASLRSLGNVQKTVSSSGSWATACSGPASARLGERPLVHARAAAVAGTSGIATSRGAPAISSSVDDAQALADPVLDAPALVPVDRRAGAGRAGATRRSAISSPSSSTSRCGHGGIGRQQQRRGTAPLTARPPGRRSYRGPRPSRPTRAAADARGATRTGPSAPRRIHPGRRGSVAGRGRAEGRLRPAQRVAKPAPATSSVGDLVVAAHATSGTPAPSASGTTSVVNVASAAPSATTDTTGAGCLTP